MRALVKGAVTDQDLYIVYGATEEGGEFYPLSPPTARDLAIRFAELRPATFVSVAVVRATLHWPSFLGDEFVYYRSMPL